MRLTAAICTGGASSRETWSLMDASLISSLMSLGECFHWSCSTWKREEIGCGHGFHLVYAETPSQTAMAMKICCFYVIASIELLVYVNSASMVVDS